jgi:hypothetical protein
VLFRKRWLSKCYIDHLDESRFVIEVKQEIISQEEARDIIVNSGLVSGLAYVVTASSESACPDVFSAVPFGDENICQQSRITVKPGMTARAYKPSNESVSLYVPYDAQFSGMFGTTSKGLRLGLTVGHIFPKPGVECKTRDDQTFGRCLLTIKENDLAILMVNSDDGLDIDNSVCVTLGGQPQDLGGMKYNLRVANVIPAIKNQLTRVLVLRKDGKWYRGLITASSLLCEMTNGRERRKVMNMMNIQRQLDDGSWVEVAGEGDSGGLVVQDPFHCDICALRSDDMSEPDLLVYGIVCGRHEHGHYTVCNTLYEALQKAEEEFSRGYEPAAGAMEFARFDNSAPRRRRCSVPANGFRHVENVRYLHSASRTADKGHGYP